MGPWVLRELGVTKFTALPIRRFCKARHPCPHRATTSCKVGFVIAASIALPKATAKAKAKAASIPAALATAPPQKQPWLTFKKRLVWTKWKKQNVARVKQYLRERGQPYSNPERKVKHWQSDVIGRGRANLFHEVPRHHFGEKQDGWTHVVP